VLGAAARQPRRRDPRRRAVARRQAGRQEPLLRRQRSAPQQRPRARLLARSADRGRRSRTLRRPRFGYDGRCDEGLRTALPPPFFLAGTLPPALRASERPIAIACFRLFTVLPERPLFSVPPLRSCIAFSTFSDALLPYAAMRVLVS